jgi:hypothetical protein
MTTKAVQFIDGELVRSYKEMKKYCDEKCMKEDHLGYMEIHYLYARSYFIKDLPIDKSTQEAFDYYKAQAEKYWMNKGFYMQGMIALALHRYENTVIPAKSLPHLRNMPNTAKKWACTGKMNVVITGIRLQSKHKHC